MVVRSHVVGCGAYLPQKIVTNAELADRLRTSDDWIAQRTGIRQRHLAAEGEFTSDLATNAAEAALASAGIAGDDIDLLVLATTTPDHTFPATATKVQARIGMTRGAAFDIQAVCSGFVYALATADNFIKAGQAKTALVIGAETFSRILDWNDRGTCVLFGDGAGAVVLRAGEGQGSVADRGVLTTHLFSDGQYYKLLYVDGGPSATRTTGHVQMEGREVFRHAVVKMGEAVDTALFVVIAFAVDLPNDLLLSIFVSNYIFKCSVEALFTPITYQVVNFLKRAEYEDYYDRDTDFNPFQISEI